MRTFLIIAGFISLPWIGYAQQHTVSLDSSRKAALAYSIAIKNGQINLLSADAGLKSAKSNYLPGVSGFGAALYGFKDIIPSIPDVLDNGINNIYIAGVTASQSIYAGGRVKAGNELAALKIDAQKILLNQSTDSVLLLTEQKYWNIVNLQEQHKTITANEALLNGLLKMQGDMLAAGLIPRNEMLKVKVQLSQLMVTKSRLNNNRMLALFDFSIYTSIPYDSLMIMADTINKSIVPSLPDGIPDTSLIQLNSFRLLTLQVKSSLLQTQLTRGEGRPSFSLGLSASQTGSFNGAFGSSFVPIAFGTLSIPISEGLWGGNKHKIRQRKLEEQTANNNLQDGKNYLQLGILQHWYNLKDALTQINYAKDNLDQATENLKVNQDNYKAGLTNVNDVLDAQALYQQAEVTLNAAFTDFQIRKTYYDFSVGKIAEGRK